MYTDNSKDNVCDMIVRCAGVVTTVALTIFISPSSVKWTKVLGMNKMALV